MAAVKQVVDLLFALAFYLSLALPFYLPAICAAYAIGRRGVSRGTLFYFAVCEVLAMMWGGFWIYLFFGVMG